MTTLIILGFVTIAQIKFLVKLFIRICIIQIVEQLRTRRAVRYIREMSDSSSQSLLVECDDGKNYVLKHRNNTQSEHGTALLIAEYLSYLVAKDISLNIPEMCFLLVSRKFADSQSDNDNIYRLLSGCVGLNIGSLHLEELTPVTAISTIERAINEVHFPVIYGFDQYIFNNDRTVEDIYHMSDNANLLISNNSLELWVIDHAVAIWPMLEMPSRGLRSPIPNSPAHILYSFMGYDFRNFIRLISQIYDTVINEYLDTVPGEWFDGYLTRVFLTAFLSERRKNIRDIIQESTDE